MNASESCAGPVLRRIRMETGGGDELLEVISVGLDGGVCHDIARPFDSVEELAAATEHLLSDRSAYGDAIERGRAFAGSFIHRLGEPGGAVRRLDDLVAELRRS